MKKGSLCVVGTGIHHNQISFDTQDEIEDADQVFYLVADPVTARWIVKTNSNSESLHDCYAPGKDRAVSYEEMAERIMRSVQSGLRVCAAFYGHPGLFVKASHEVIRRAKEGGFAARMLPAISAADCLFADLGIGGRGCQIFEATDFLVQSRIFDPTSALVLFQVGIIGDFTFNASKSVHPGLKLLIDYLLQFYEESHPVVLYEAAPLPRGNPVIIRSCLAEIDPSHLTLATSLYVVPKAQRPRKELDLHQD